MNYRSYFLFYVCSFLFCSNLFSANFGSLPLVPEPMSVKTEGADVFVNVRWKVYIDPRIDYDVAYLSSTFKEKGIGLEIVDKKGGAVLLLTLDQKLSENPEAYRLTVTGKGKITVSAPTKKGILYAMQTLRQLLGTTNEGKVSLPCCAIDDQPAFSWRAFMLDESRHFQGMETVKRLLDEMAQLKMNTFHWHLVDDPGWRIEIKRYPELTAIGSKRDFSHANLTPAEWDAQFPGQKMFYTQDEIRQIVKYAEERGITVVPEIEIPGHASASISAYPWLGANSREEGKGIWGDLYNITDPAVEEFLHNVLDEVIALFPSKIIHIGGDEANYTFWQKNEQIVQFMKENDIPTFSDLQVWSINRFSKYLSSKGIRMMGWNEITGDNIRNEAHIKASQTEKLALGTIVHFWDGEISLVNKAIEKGYNVVNSNRHFTYLDYSYEVIPLDKAYSFNPVPEGLPKENECKILGLGCQMWGEYTPTLSRLYYQVFPRIAAYAECSWSKHTEKNYNEFCSRMTNIEARWRQLGYLDQQPTFSK